MTAAAQEVHTDRRRQSLDRVETRQTPLSSRFQHDCDIGFVDRADDVDQGLHRGERHAVALAFGDADPGHRDPASTNLPSSSELMASACNARNPIDLVSNIVRDAGEVDAGFHQSRVTRRVSGVVAGTGRNRCRS